MSKSSFIEDIFLEFSNKIFGKSFIDYRDVSPISSFCETLTSNLQLTKAQADFILKILKKYQTSMKEIGFDYSESLSNPQWKNSFRILDLSKNVYIENNLDNQIEICLKFPFSFKSTFEKEYLAKLSNRVSMRWDPDKKINRLYLYQINLPLLNDFLIEHKFLIDESFLQVLAEIEEIWQSQDSIEPKVIIFNGQVHLKNYCVDADLYWSTHRCGILEKDLLLAKNMGFKLQQNQDNPTIFEKIAGSETNLFWCKDFMNFFEIYKKLDGVVVIVLDRSDHIVEWLTEFVDAADAAMVSRSDIKVCFRDDNKEETKINTWIRENNLGGKIDHGKIFIFRHKPAKWLFNGKFSVKIVATNSLFLMTNTTTQRWIDSHNFVIYLGSIRTSQIKERQIVEL